MTKIRQYISLLKADYRHLICFCATVVFTLCGLMFPNALPRLLETLRDLLISFIYYLANIAELEHLITPTVVNPQSWIISSELWQPITFLPKNLDEFLIFWSYLGEILFTEENFLAYVFGISDFLYYSSKVLSIFLPLVLALYLFIDGYKDETCTERGKKSLQLIKFQKLLYERIIPAKEWCKEFWTFITYYNYHRIWKLLWLLYLNVFSIVLAFAAYYLYFVSSWDVLSIYGQFLKLQTDLTPMIRFVPGIVWLVVGLEIYNYICRSIAFDRLQYAERANRAVLKQRGVVTVVSGEMGKGKTQLITSMALTAQNKIYDDMYDVMRKYELMFPNFKWQLFRDELNMRIRRRQIVDLDSCRENVVLLSKWFDYVCSTFTYQRYSKILTNYQGLPDRVFGYDYDHYRTSYNDELKIIDLFKGLEEYACAYYTFSVETCLIFSNYSIREDSILSDRGNKKYRDNDFFKRSPELQELYSRYSHIIDMDMIRLQRKMIENNEFGRVLHPGVYVISEIDKERKNMLELKELKIKTDETNQKNDGFNPSLMMSRHANIIDYIPVIYAFLDLQRAEAWGAGGRELGDNINIVEKGDLIPALPFFSPYWFTEGVFQWLKGKWDNFKVEYDINRCDETLFVYLVENLMSAINTHYERINNLFGMQVLTLEIQSGKLEGPTKIDYWTLMPKKDRSERYRTDCLKSIFVCDPPNEKHIDDFRMYGGILATPEELEMQNSYFQNDIKKMKGSK